MDTDGRTSRLLSSRGANVDRHKWRSVPTPPTLRNARAFVDALNSGINNEPSFRRAAALQRVIDAAFVSAEEDRTVTLD